MKPVFPITVLAFAGAILGGCGPSTGGSTSGELAGAVSSGTSPYALLDLQSRSLSYAVSVPDVATNPLYRDRIMVFRRTGPEGARFLAGIFEVTQAQWLRLSGTTPWTGIPTAVVAASAHSGDRPVYGLDHETLAVELAAFSLSGGARLTVQRADHDLGRSEVVVDGAAFAQEFGVINQLHRIRPLLAQSSAEQRDDDLFGRTGAHGRAVGHRQPLTASGTDRRSNRWRETV